MFFVIFWTALVRYTWLSNSSRFFSNNQYFRMFLVSMADIIGSYERLPNDAVRAVAVAKRREYIYIYIYVYIYIYKNKYMCVYLIYRHPQIRCLKVCQDGSSIFCFLQNFQGFLFIFFGGVLDIHARKVVVRRKCEFGNSWYICM